MVRKLIGIDENLRYGSGFRIAHGGRDGSGRTFRYANEVFGAGVGNHIGHGESSCFRATVSGAPLILRLWNAGMSAPRLESHPEQAYLNAVRDLGISTTSQTSRSDSPPPETLAYHCCVRPGYAGGMFRLTVPYTLFLSAAALALGLFPANAAPQKADSSWAFAVSGDSRNCGDFVMPVIASKVKAEKDAFYWHLGDFRAMSAPDQDLLAMLPAGTQLSKTEYQQRAWDDFITHQLDPFGAFPVFLGRGNHETVAPMTREGYVAKFSKWLERPEIVAQRTADGAEGAPTGPWYHWTQNGVDFITLDNSSHDEFTDAQLHWLRDTLDHDLDAHSGIHTIVAGMHEALPHSSSSNHAMDDWELGVHTGEMVYRWFYDAQVSGKHVYLIASHSHYYSPDIFNTPYWKLHTKKIVPGWIIGTAGAHRYLLPKEADKASKTFVYGYMKGTVHADGTIDFALHELSEDDLMKAKWPNAPAAAIHECFIHNGDMPGGM